MMPGAAFSSNDFAALERVIEVDGETTKTLPENIETRYDLESCVQWIAESSLERICLQFPDDLLPDSSEIALRLGKQTNRNVYILGDSSYGSCCVDEVTAQHINADGIIHFGHACLNPTSRLPVFHVLPKSELHTNAFCSTFEEYFKDTDEKLLIFYDVAFAHAIESICDILAPKYKRLKFTKLNCLSSVKYTDSVKDFDRNVIFGRILNLEFDDDVKEHQALFLGPDGKTLNNFVMEIEAKSWHHYDKGTIQECTVTNSVWLKRRRYLVEKLKDAHVIGIVVATLGIKDYLESITTIKNSLKEKNKKSYILCVGKPNPAKLANFPEVDVFVVIGCPENRLYDSRDFFKPILTPFEVELAFNSAREFSTRYSMDFRQILSGGANHVAFQTSNESDVSLISGNIRNLMEDESSVNSTSALVSRSAGTVALGKAGADYLLQRSWQGLEQRLGQDEVKTVEKGRCGLPVAYESEPIKRET